VSGRYRCLSGSRFDDAAALAYVGPAESGVLLTRPGRPGGPPVELGLRLVRPTLLTGLWRSPAGRVWVVDRDGWVRWCDDPWPHDAPWGQLELDLAFRGVTGAGEEAWAWGDRPSDGASLVRRYDGRKWKPVTAPGFAVRAMACGEHTWAVGHDGWVARYDVDRWTVLAAAPGRELVSACVVPGGVIVGAADGEVFQGGVDGFRTVAKVGGPALALASWRGAVWVGCGPAGLFRCDGAVATLVRADRACRSLEAHEHLLIGCDEVLCSSPDGARFPAVGRGSLPQG